MAAGSSRQQSSSGQWPQTPPAASFAPPPAMQRSPLSPPLPLGAAGGGGAGGVGAGGVGAGGVGAVAFPLVVHLPLMAPLWVTAARENGYAVSNSPIC